MARPIAPFSHSTPLEPDCSRILDILAEGNVVMMHLWIPLASWSDIHLDLTAVAVQQLCEWVVGWKDNEDVFPIGNLKLGMPDGAQASLFDCQFHSKPSSFRVGRLLQVRVHLRFRF